MHARRAVHGRQRPAHRDSADDPGGQCVCRLQRVYGVRGDRAVGDPVFALHQLRAELERAEGAQHGIAAGAERADCCRPDHGLRLRVLAALPLPDARRRDHGRAVDRWRRDVQQAGTRIRRAGLRSADLAHGVSHQRLPDDGDRRHGPRLPGVDRARARDAAQARPRGTQPRRRSPGHA